jgi:Major Facilitator Superfamily
MPKIRGLRWWMISLVMLGSIINYLTRSTLAVAAPTMLQDLHIGAREYSWIVGAFQGAIMLQPLCGYVLDVLGLKKGFAIFATAWSLISMAHGLAYNWPMLAGLRGLLGLAFVGAVGSFQGQAVPDLTGSVGKVKPCWHIIWSRSWVAVVLAVGTAGRPAQFWALAGSETRKITWVAKRARIALLNFLNFEVALLI